jgi:hypothetical protein
MITHHRISTFTVAALLMENTDDKNSNCCSTHPRRYSSLWSESLSTPHKKEQRRQRETR